MIINKVIYLELGEELGPTNGHFESTWRSGPGNLNKPLGGESATVDAPTGR